ncbi:MAG: hypothetical protein HY717_04315 [Planctomycetes bacterium]|nr:hypothetical protein [Planctomycetota bacterium]
MRIKKEVLDPKRIRRIPSEGFSWIDRRFVREGFIDRLPGDAILLYFFLVAVSDAQGLSFYADPTIRKTLKLDGQALTQARQRLITAELILFRYPIYQVLQIPQRAPNPNSPPRISTQTIPRGGDFLSLREIFDLAGFKGADGANSKAKKDD